MTLCPQVTVHRPKFTNVHVSVHAIEMPNEDLGRRYERSNIGKIGC